MTTNTFEDAIDYQFELKKKYRIGSQLWGNMTCYTTLTNCYSGLRCLTWHNICDGKYFVLQNTTKLHLEDVFQLVKEVYILGKQQCMDGVDEDNCEELEFNECEENEYRCQDGSCIPEQYWLDGEYDCSDKSDEQDITEYVQNVSWCPVTSSQFNCDEITVYYKFFACGDGEFMWDSWMSTVLCYNYRAKMFFCEFKYASTDSAMWTLQNGHCVERGWIEKNFTDMNESEKCIFFLKCILTNGKNDGCDEASRTFDSLCKDKHIQYPPGAFFRPYLQRVHVLNKSKSLSTFIYTYLNGSIKCIGYQARSDQNEIVLTGNPSETEFRFDSLLCDRAKHRNASGPHFDKYCWNDTKKSITCEKSHRCISKYRVLDGYRDCQGSEDTLAAERHNIKSSHRFYCDAVRIESIPITLIGTSNAQCHNGADEYLPQLSWNLADHKCTKSNAIECKVLRDYIQSSSLILRTENSKTLVFRQYCDTMWQLPNGFDESFCNEWKCPRDQYQCLTNHCIPINYVTNQAKYGDWHCPDASDKIGLFRITQLSEHNTRLIDQNQLQEIKEFFESKRHQNKIPFGTICNLTKEYGCILANVKEPFNFKVNPPCINLTQIGDGKIDCYGGLDERNLLTCGNNTSQQRGFDFHCNDQECIPYNRHCQLRCSNSEDSLLCDQLPSHIYPHCINTTREQMCDSTAIGCKESPNDLYYCDLSRTRE
jgi:hypothetical protein